MFFGLFSLFLCQRFQLLLHGSVLVRELRAVRTLRDLLELLLLVQLLDLLPQRVAPLAGGLAARLGLGGLLLQRTVHLVLPRRARLGRRRLLLELLEDLHTPAA